MRARVRIPSLTSSLLKNRSGITQAPAIVMHEMGAATAKVPKVLHVIASSKNSYELRYYNIHDQDAEEDED